MGLFCAYEYASLLAEKKEKYEEFKEARKAMVEYQTAKDNVDRILGVAPLEKELEKKKEFHRWPQKIPCRAECPSMGFFCDKTAFFVNATVTLRLHRNP